MRFGRLRSSKKADTAPTKGDDAALAQTWGRSRDRGVPIHWIGYRPGTITYHPPADITTVIIVMIRGHVTSDAASQSR